MTIPRRDARTATAFSEWVRNNPRLDAKAFGLANMDIDWLWHQYLVSTDKIGERAVNHIMLIEEKAGGSDLSFAERDSMLLIDQALKLADSSGKKFKTLRGDRLTVRFWGVFKLRYDGTCLRCAKSIEWNKRQIDLPTLEEILLFTRNPQTLKPHSDRRHHTKRYPMFDGGPNIPNS